MSRVRIEIDLNSRDADGLTRARIADASGKLEPGQIVTAFESEDDVQALAMVRRIDAATGYVLLDVNWQSMRDDDHNSSAMDYTMLGVNRAMAIASNRSMAASGADVVSVRALRVNVP